MERGLTSPGLVAHVLAPKRCDHLPLYRQSRIFAREGVFPPQLGVSFQEVGTAYLYWPSDEASAVLEPHRSHGRPEKPRGNGRRVISGILTAAQSPPRNRRAPAKWPPKRPDDPSLRPTFGLRGRERGREWRFFRSRLGPAARRQLCGSRP